MMSLSVSYFRERIRNAHPRTRRAQLNTILSLVIKGSGMIVSLLLVPLTIDFLSKETYGTWLTISSIVTMLTFFDIGIGNGLRNKLSEAIAKQDIGLARAYVSTAYIVFGGLQTVFVVVFLFVFRYIPWTQILNTSINNSQLQSVILLMSTAMAVKLVLDILSYVLLAVQESSLTGFISLMSNVLVLLGTYVLTHYSRGNLFYLALITALTPIITLLIAGIVLYPTRLKVYRPSLQKANLIYTKSLLSLGYKFFFIQLTVIILFYTDNLIITHLFGPAEVTTYNIAFRYFNAISTIFSIVMTPYWSAFTEAYVKKDSAWMTVTYNYLQKLWMGLAVVVIVMVLVANQVYSIWVGDRVIVPIILSACMGLFVIISCWNNVAVTVINGLGKIKLQLYLSIFSAAINIPFSIYFGRYLGLGSAGVVLATSFSLLIGSVFLGIQASKLITRTASGIWNS